MGLAINSRIRSLDEARATLLALRDALRDRPDGPETDELAERLARSELAPAVLCDPSGLTLQEALAIARRTVRFSPGLDLKVLRLVQPGSDGRIVADSLTCRAFAIVNEVTSGSHVMPQLIKLLRAANDRVVSQLILIMSRVRKDAAWLEPYCTHADPRVRANSIEALWGNSDRESVALLTAAVRDSNHRVAVNALLGLYRVGVAQARIELIKLGDHPDPLWRSAAAWSFGRIGEVSVLDPLRKLMTDPDRRVRGAALRAIVRLRKADSVGTQS